MIKVKKLSKYYSVQKSEERMASFRELLSQFLFSPLEFFRPGTQFFALKNISFTLMKGDSLAVIGKNGSGKSTLLKILSKVTTPSSGTVSFFGKSASLLEVGTGFHGDLTGRENIFLNGSILGMSLREIQSKFELIVDFAEVHGFLDTPIKRYSSGMKLRLAFAIAASVDPDILIVDEVLAVGDIKFRQKCITKMQSLKDEGKTFLSVAHDTELLLALCNKGLVLDAGQQVYFGSLEGALDAYTKITTQSYKTPKQPSSVYQGVE